MIKVKKEGVGSGTYIGAGWGEKRLWGKKLSPKREARAMLAKDLEKLQESPEELGLTESEKDRISAKAQEQSDARAGAQMSQLQRTALAGQGFQAGEMQKAARGVAQESTSAAVKARAGAEEASREMIARESARIRSALDRARGRAKKFAAQTAQVIGDVGMAYGAEYAHKLGGTTDGG